jgi:CubicO group peptidase (beta-lactamase class C family)
MRGISGRLILLLYICVITTVAWPASIHAQAQEPDQQKLAHIESYVREQFREAGFPGGSFAIVYKDKVLLAEGIGYSDLLLKQKASPKTVYSVASIAKVMTAAAILQLSESGRIKLDGYVTDYLPWFQFQDKERSAKVKVKDLLLHAAGINRFKADGAVFNNEKLNRGSLENNIRSLKDVPMNSDPGTKGQYCNTCYNTLGLIIEKVTGQSYDGYMHDFLFEPLGMKRTTFPSHNLSDSDTAVEYGYLFGIRKPVTPYWQEFGKGLAPNGGAYSDSLDLSRFISALLGYGDRNAIVPNTFGMYASTAVVATDSQPGNKYVLNGFEEKQIAGTTLFHKGGEGVGSTVDLAVIPQKEVGVVLLIGEADSEARYKIADGILKILLDKEPESVKGSANGLQVLGYVALSIIGISVLLLVWLGLSLLRIRKAVFTIRRRWTIWSGLSISVILSIPLWYLLLAVRLSEAGFYGYPYDLAIALISLTATLTAWIVYLVLLLARPHF